MFFFSLDSLTPKYEARFFLPLTSEMRFFNFGKLSSAAVSDSNILNMAKSATVNLSPAAQGPFTSFSK